jgi:hypothetical protein
MKAYRENPNGEENQSATRQNEREVFALKMMEKALNTYLFEVTYKKNGEQTYCHV